MKKQYHHIFVIVTITLFTCFISFSFAQQSKQEVKEAKKQRDELVFNVKLKNKNVSKKIQFKLHKNLVIVPVTINGKTYNLIFDTGATISLFSDSLAKNLNVIQSEYSGLVSDGAGIIETVNFYRTDDVNIGSLRFDNVGYGVANLDVFEKHLCMRIDGLLGSNIIRLLNWEIDFSNQTIIISDKSFSAKSYSMKMPFRESFNHIPEIKIQRGKYFFYATLDMGYNDQIKIQEGLFFKYLKSEHIKYAKGEGKDTETLFNDDTPQNQFVSEIDSIYIGNNLLFNKIVNTTPAPVILVGNAFLMQYGKMAINWKQKKLFLEKKEDNKIVDNSTFFEFTPNLQEDKLIVSFVWENTNSYRKGVRVGDQIMSINGISTEKINSSQWCELKEKIEKFDNITVEIVKPAGERMTVQVQKITNKSLIE